MPLLYNSPLPSSVNPRFSRWAPPRCHCHQCPPWCRSFSSAWIAQYYNSSSLSRATWQCDSMQSPFYDWWSALLLTNVMFILPGNWSVSHWGGRGTDSRQPPGRFSKCYWRSRKAKGEGYRQSSSYFWILSLYHITFIALPLKSISWAPVGAKNSSSVEFLSLNLLPLFSNKSYLIFV